MKKRLTFFVLLNLAVMAGFSQVPNYFNYQVVVRNTVGEVISDADVSFRISILQNSESGSAVYVETHSAYTNEFGLVNLKIGDGSIVSGSFTPGNWGTNSHFLKVEMDANGGSSYAEFGTSQLVAVPYAFHAKTVENDAVDDADADPENEIQTLSLTDSELTLSKGGGKVTLPTGSASPWEINASDIYYNSGKVTLGSNTPSPNGLLSIYGKDDNGWISFNNDATGNTAADGMVIGPLYNGSMVYFWNQENSPLVFASDNKERLRIAEDGNIGIGTKNPATKLHISDGGILLDNNPFGIRMESSTFYNSLTNDEGNLLISNFGYGEIHLRTSTILGIANSKLVVKNNGYIGIGTQSPGAGLHLKGTGYPSAFMYIQSDAGQDAGIRLYEGTTAKWHIFNNSAAGGLQIYNDAAKTAIFAKQSNSYVGIGTTSPAYALHVNGDAAKTTGSTAWIISSDQRLKDIHGIYNKGLAEIVKLQPIRYNYKKDNPRQLSSDKEQVGFIAQEVQKVFPEAVNQEEDGYLDFNIHSINVAMVNAVKDLSKENIQLKKKVEDLENRLEKLESYFVFSASKNN